MKQNLLAKGYTQDTTNPNRFEHCWGHSSGDMEYVNIQSLTYSREFAEDNDENFTVQCSSIEELMEWIAE